MATYRCKLKQHRRRNLKYFGGSLICSEKSSSFKKKTKGSWRSGMIKTQLLEGALTRITQSFTNIGESLIPKFIVTQIQIFNSIGCMFFYKLADLWHMIIRQIYNKKSIKKNNLLFDDKSTSPVRACYLKYSVRLNFPSFTTLIGTKSFLSPDKFYKLGLFLINYFLTSSCLLFKSI